MQLFNSLSVQLRRWGRKGQEQKEKKLEQRVNKAPVKVHQEGRAMPRFALGGLFGSYDTFTYLPEQNSFSFICAHASRRIKIHLEPFEVLLPGDKLLGCRAELI